MRIAIVHWKIIEKLIWESISKSFDSLINFQFLRIELELEGIGKIWLQFFNKYSQVLYRSRFSFQFKVVFDLKFLFDSYTTRHLCQAHGKLFNAPSHNLCAKNTLKLSWMTRPKLEHWKSNRFWLDTQNPWCRRLTPYPLNHGWFFTALGLQIYRYTLSSITSSILQI